MEQALTGGNITSVVRVGDTVLRTPGPWTSGVHALLRHLEYRAFRYAPRVLGFDEAQREILTFIEGTAGFHDVSRVSPDNLWSDQVLTDAARVLRALHDATVDFVPPPDASWQVVYPDRARHEVMCHNDFAPYNCVFQDGHLAGVIDFDTAGPGPRVWDVAYAAYRFIPLVPPEIQPRLGVHPESNAGYRLRLFCDAYGLKDRGDFLDELISRIDAVTAMLLEGARNGISGYIRILAEGGHLEGLERDKMYIQMNRAMLQNWLVD